tara:strand:+ start:137 stop:886 length:750 start_codon:yes stop_codon:yes gene_type:complete
MIKLEIDYREKALIKNLDDKNVSYEINNLEVGDVRFLDGSLNEVIIIERKTLKDLASSIKDSRYYEQSLRLEAHELHNHNIIYLIEGDMDYYTPPPIQNPITKDALYSSMFSILYFKGFSVIKTKNLNETAEIINRFYNKLIKEKKESYYSGSVNKSDNYITAIKTAKKDNITIDNIDIIMLSQIPGVSIVSATNIIEITGSLIGLIDMLKKSRNSLNEISYETKTGKKRKISKTAIENIIKYLKIETL